jgi:hypothetical protein
MMMLAELAELADLVELMVARQNHNFTPRCLRSTSVYSKQIPHYAFSSVPSICLSNFVLAFELKLPALRRKRHVE